MADFYFPQRGIFAVGRVFVSLLEYGTEAGTREATAAR
jgi:hypothetical protein